MAIESSTVPEKTPMPWGLYVVGALGGLLFGFDTGVISGAGPLVQNDWGLNAAQLGFITASVLIGSMIGALSVGRLSDKFGRKKLFVISAIIFIIGGIGLMFAPAYGVMCTFRIILGFAIGATSSLTPTYLVELADKNHRGSIASMFQLMITIGIEIAYFINLAFLHHTILGLADWRWMFGSELLPAAILMIGSIILPESPRFLVKEGRIEEAKTVLATRLHRSAIAAEAELQDIKDVLAHDPGQGSFAELFKTSGKSVLVAILLMFFQQLVGINAIIYFTPKIFEASFHFNASNAIWISVGIGAVNVISTIVATRLMDKFGRKTWLIFGSIVMSIAFAVIIILNLTLGTSNMISAVITMIFIAIFIIGFAVSWGPICWIMISEIFPLKVRGVGTSVGSAANWIGDFIVSQFFTMILAASHNNIAVPFLIFFAFALLSILFVKKLVPETRGRSLEQIEEEEIK